MLSASVCELVVMCCAMCCSVFLFFCIHVLFFCRRVPMLVLKIVLVQHRSMSLQRLTRWVCFAHFLRREHSWVARVTKARGPPLSRWLIKQMLMKRLQCLNSCCSGSRPKLLLTCAALGVLPSLGHRSSRVSPLFYCFQFIKWTWQRQFLNNAVAGTRVPV